MQMKPELYFRQKQSLFIDTVLEVWYGWQTLAQELRKNSETKKSVMQRIRLTEIE